MASVVKIKRSSVQGKAPTTSDLEQGEIALNTRDKKLFSSDGSSVFEVGSNVHSISVGTGGLSVGNGAITFPTSDGSADQVLVTDGSGQLSFASQSGGSGDTLGYTNSTITINTLLDDGSEDLGGFSAFSTDAFGVYLNGEVMDMMEPIREIVSIDMGALT